MSGIAGILNLRHEPVPDLKHRLRTMGELLEHRGEAELWVHPNSYVGLAGLGRDAVGSKGNRRIVYDGEIYNSSEIKKGSDADAVLQAYQAWGNDCLNHFRGMFAFAMWNEQNQALVCARDRFGIKPLYYTIVDSVFYFASEAKALLPFLDSIETDLEGFKDYITFQYYLDGKTLFKGVRELPPAHAMLVKDGMVDIWRYWEVYYNLDFDHTTPYFERELKKLIEESVELHLRGDIPFGAYVSGGFDSSIVASVACQKYKSELVGFHGKFDYGPEYDESHYARALARKCGFRVEEVPITAQDFIDNIRKVIYHLDYPTMGPGSFPQFMVAKRASGQRKVLLGGQGGDEIFGGYVRYIIAYFEQCIKAAIDGTMHSGNFVVTYESIIPNLVALQQYKPLLKQFWQEGLFEDMERRYFRLINRANLLNKEIRWEYLKDYSPFETFKSIFHGNNIQKESYFDLMTHFDFKAGLPPMLQVEDRVSSAHGIEVRLPYLDLPIVEFAATMPSNVKFKDGTMKNVLKQAMKDMLPPEILSRKDKMGFPTPIVEWARNEAKDFVHDIFSTQKALQRDLVDNRLVLEGLEKEEKYSRKIWGLLCLELWQQEFHDKQHVYKGLVTNRSR
jgi:asparagine synthase (glutamine-hydrolysing)